MRAYIMTILCMGALVFGIAPPVQADANDFTIRSFTGDYYISRGEDGVSAMKVTEKIVAGFPKTDQNHGIVRAIPESYQGHSLELAIQSVNDGQGRALTYDTDHENGNTVLKIGDEDTFVHGETEYVITYTMRGVTLPQADHQEFYWDINGDQWQQSFERVTARVHVPAEIAGSLQDRTACYIGVPGSNNQGCTIAKTGGQGDVIIRYESPADRPLAPGETMTVVAAFNQSTFAGYAPSTAQMMQWVATAVFAVIPPLAAIIFMVRRWHRYGRDPRGKGVIVPQYLPPKEVSVLGANAILRENFETKAITATILDFAVRHYIKIYETEAAGTFRKAQYEIELVGALPAQARDEERAVLAMLFPSRRKGDRVTLQAITKQLDTDIIKTHKTLTARLAAEGFFRTPPDKARKPYYIGGSSIAAAGILLGLVCLMFDQPGLALSCGGFIIAGVIVLFAADFMPARTRQGVALRDYLYGLRDYMKSAEAERLKALQGPQGSLTQKIDTANKKQLILLYEKLLPYAVLFGIEKDWAAHMAGLYDDTPDWYGGHGTFSAVWFAGSLNSFSASAATTFSTSASSGSSGFGGAAGGGGGGGGGGW